MYLSLVALWILGPSLRDPRCRGGYNIQNFALLLQSFQTFIYISVHVRLSLGGAINYYHRGDSFRWCSCAHCGLLIDDDEVAHQRKGERVILHVHAYTIRRERSAKLKVGESRSNGMLATVNMP